MGDQHVEIWQTAKSDYGARLREYFFIPQTLTALSDSIEIGREVVAHMKSP